MHQINTTQAQRPAKLGLLAIYFGFFMVVLDTTVVNVALPHLQSGLGASLSELQWVVDGYSLVFASLLLTAGSLGDRPGGKRIFLLGLTVFTLTSALCGAAPTLATLQAARVVQGIGAALMVPASLALLRHAFPNPGERARAIGLWGATAGTAAGAGPVVGGLLVDLSSWRSVFLINVPVGLLAVLLTLRFVDTPPRLRQKGLDLPGQIAGIAALGLLAFAFIEGGEQGWLTTPVLVALAASLAIGALFIAIERRTRHPMLPIGLFDNATFSAGNAVGFLANFGIYGQFFVIGLYFQQVRDYSPLATGVALLPQMGMIAVGAALSGRVTERRGPRLPMAAGLAIGGLGLLGMMLIGENTPYLAMTGWLVAAGFGLSFMVPAMTAAVTETAPEELAGTAASVLSASRQVGSVLGVALLGGLVGGTTNAGFVTGLHLAMLLAGGAFLLALGVTLLGVRAGLAATRLPRPQPSAPRTPTVGLPATPRLARRPHGPAGS